MNYRQNYSGLIVGLCVPSLQVRGRCKFNFTENLKYSRSFGFPQLIGIGGNVTNILKVQGSNGGQSGNKLDLFVVGVPRKCQRWLRDAITCYFLLCNLVSRINVYIIFETKCS